jgi:hypothetical protein
MYAAERLRLSREIEAGFNRRSRSSIGSVIVKSKKIGSQGALQGFVGDHLSMYFVTNAAIGD